MKNRFEELGWLFSQGFNVQAKDGSGKIIGKGLFQTQLESQGFTKKYLHRLCMDGAIRKSATLTERNGGMRTTYILDTPETKNVI